MYFVYIFQQYLESKTFITLKMELDKPLVPRRPPSSLARKYVCHGLKFLSLVDNFLCYYLKLEILMLLLRTYTTFAACSHWTRIESHYG